MIGVIGNWDKYTSRKETREKGIDQGMIIARNNQSLN